MTKFEIKAVPTMDWMTQEAVEVVKNFNKCGHKLVLVPWEEDFKKYPIQSVLDEGCYCFEFPDCPEAVILEQMIEEAGSMCAFIHFEVSDLVLS